jgi:hypothetical protein
MTTPAAILVLSNVIKFLLAGHAKFTLVSKVSGHRKTFEVVKAPPKDGFPEGWFVKLLVGPDNGSDYRYLGIIRRHSYVGTPNGLAFAPNREGFGVDACNAMVWFIKLINENKDARFNEQAEFWHSGYCSRCGRELTDPESIARGLGPVCAEKE